MEKKGLKSNDLTFELNVRLQLKDWKSKLSFKKTWVIALAVALIQLGLKVWLKNH